MFSQIEGELNKCTVRFFSDIQMRMKWFWIQWVPVWMTVQMQWLKFECSGWSVNTAVVSMIGVLLSMNAVNVSSNAVVAIKNPVVVPSEFSECQCNCNG